VHRLSCITYVRLQHKLCCRCCCRCVCPCCCSFLCLARGFETCSIMLEGQMEHQDSAGNKVGRRVYWGCGTEGFGVCRGGLGGRHICRLHKPSQGDKHWLGLAAASGLQPGLAPWSADSPELGMPRAFPVQVRNRCRGHYFQGLDKGAQSHHIQWHLYPGLNHTLTSFLTCRRADAVLL